MEILIALVGGLLVLFFLAVGVFAVRTVLRRRRDRLDRLGRVGGTDRL